jgi:hypothetical protein
MTRETTKMETEKTKRIKRIVTVSLCGSEKKAEGKYNTIYKSGSRKKGKCKRKNTEKSGYD